jgi:hypothetical protein
MIMSKLTHGVSIFIASLFFGFSGNAQSLSLLTQTAGPGNEELSGIVTDVSGNIFHSG